MPKSLLPVSAITLSLLAGSAIAKDTESDAQLREALRQKVSEMTNQPVATQPVAPAAKAPAPAATAPATTPTPPPPKPATVTITAPVVQPLTASPAATASGISTSAPPVFVDDPETAKLREALRQRLDQETVSPTPPTPIVEVTPPPSVPSGGATSAKTAPAKAAPAKAAPAKAAPTKAAPPQATPGSKPPAGYAPLVPPPLPISGSKQERLKELLDQYKADLITPTEYHAQRAKIIAE